MGYCQIKFHNRTNHLEFDAEVQKERIKAQDALKDIQEIEALVRNAVIKVNETQTALLDAETNAKNAREIAQHAQVINEMIYCISEMLTCINYSSLLKKPAIMPI